MARQNKEQEARLRFSEHVQSIAFNLTLSRRMISLLQTVRDYGFPGMGDQQGKVAGEVTHIPYANASYPNGAYQYIKFTRALEARGLILHTWPVKQGDPTLTLTRAGELTCLLLVEAGLMPPMERDPSHLRRRTAQHV